MKKFLTVVMTIAILFSSVAFADDLSALTDVELLALYQDILDEMNRRQTLNEPETEDVNEGSAEADTADIVLYYQPTGGEYYHLNQNCPLVNPAFLPLQGNFLYSELNDEPYRELKRCEICGAPFRQENEPVPMSFRDAVEAAGEYAAVGGDIDYLAVAASKDGCDYRTVTILDDRAKELYMAAMSAEDSDAAFEAFDAYAWSLPVCYTETITVKPKEQAELDAQAGRTVGELLAEGYSFYGSGGGENLPTVVDLSSGPYSYEFEVDASFEEYLEHESRNDLVSLKVKGGVLSSSLCLAPNLDYLADGTYRPPVVPNFTAEELAAADSVPPLEEYSRKAWPLDAEGYSDLQNNLDSRYGQVYVVEGIVHQVLSQSPMRVILYTGEDGKSQPVIMECPEQRSFKWEEGKSYRIYADVTSALYILPVLTARYMFSDPSADTSEEKEAFRFETFRDAVVSMEEGDAYTVSDGYAVAVIRRNGRCFRVVASLDEHAEELYIASREEGNLAGKKYRELSEHIKTLPVLYTEELTVIPFTQEELDAMAGKTIEEIMSEPWEIGMCNYPEDAEAGKDIVFPMVNGFCEYELVINEPYEVYQERRAGDRYDPITIMSLRNYLDLTVKCVRYTGISSFHALDLRYQSDGTIKRDVEPFPEDYDFDLMEKIADYLTAAWENIQPDQEAKEAMIAELTAEHPQAEEMIRQIIGSFH